MIATIVWIAGVVAAVWCVLDIFKHNISINTVITHRKNITRKTGIRTVPGLTVYAILNNLIDINSIES